MSEEVTTTPEEITLLRDQIAARYRVSLEDAEILLSGSDELTLIRQARRLTELLNPTRKA